MQQALERCLDPRNPDRKLGTARYQGRSSNAATRDLLLLAQCQGASGENFFWALAEAQLRIPRGQVQALRPHAELWDSGERKVSLHLISDAVFVASQVACYATPDFSNNSLKNPYCAVVPTVNEGVAWKVSDDMRLSGNAGPLWSAFRGCFNAARVRKVNRGRDFALVCQGESALTLLQTFVSKSNARGERYALSKEELRGPRERGTGSAVIEFEPAYTRVVFGEEVRGLGREVKLSDNARCIRERSSGHVECVLTLGSTLRAGRLLSYP